MSYLRSSLLADLLDLLELLVGSLLCVLLGLLVAAGVLLAVSHCPKVQNSHTIFLRGSETLFTERDICSTVRLTSVSKDLNSDSFCDL